MAAIGRRGRGPRHRLGADPLIECDRSPHAPTALLFGSGFCALVYQVGWLRNFRLIFGASTAASAAVLAIFVGGLGIGSLWLGPKADRHPRPLLFYSHLETIIAISAAASPLLLDLVSQIYLASGGSLRLGTTLSTIERLILSVGGEHEGRDDDESDRQRGESGH